VARKWVSVSVGQHNFQCFFWEGVKIYNRASTGRRTRSSQCLTSHPLDNQVTIKGHEVEVVESFPYLGSLIPCTGGCELEMKRRI